MWLVASYGEVQPVDSGIKCYFLTTCNKYSTLFHGVFFATVGLC